MKPVEVVTSCIFTDTGLVLRFRFLSCGPWLLKLLLHINLLLSVEISTSMDQFGPRLKVRGAAVSSLSVVLISFWSWSKYAKFSLTTSVDKKLCNQSSTVCPLSLIAFIITGYLFFLLLSFSSSFTSRSQPMVTFNCLKVVSVWLLVGMTENGLIIPRSKGGNGKPGLSGNGRGGGRGELIVFASLLHTFLPRRAMFENKSWLSIFVDLFLLKYLW